MSSKEKLEALERKENSFPPIKTASAPNVHYYHSFLFDSTVYKISDVRKREENERS